MSTPKRTIVHFSIDLEEHVCPVVRVYGPAEQSGWRVLRGNAWEDSQLVVFPEKIAQADLVLIQRDFPRYAEAYNEVVAAAREQNKEVVYELDDLLIELPPTHPDYERYMPFRPAILQAIVDADAVTCSTPAIMDYLINFNPNVRVIPNYLNDSLWTLRSGFEPEAPLDNEPVIIGYLGSRSHQPDLAMIAPLLADILNRYGGKVNLRLWGIAPPPELAHLVNVEWLDIAMVSYAEFAAYFSQQACDFFIAPLIDNRFNRSKSWIKFLEYSALGTPGIYSRVSAYTEVVSHSENGLLAETLEDWEACLTQLIENPGLRRDLGAAAQKTLRDNWLLSDHLDAWDAQMAGIYSDSLEQGRSGSARRVAETFARWHREEKIAADALQREIAQRDATIGDLQLEVGEKEYLNQIYVDQLDAIHGSTGWKLLEALYTIRLALMPHDSSRERAMQIGIHSLRIAKNEGPRSLASKWRVLLRSRDSGAILGDAFDPKPRTATILEGQPCPAPAISVIIEESSLLPTLDRQAVIAWTGRQTLRGAQVVIWDRDAGQAWDSEDPDTFWQATDPPALFKQIGGRYICMASEELPGLPETYLESNLAALESEALLFTVNTLGNSGWATRHLHLGLLPGDRLRPLFRIVVRKEFVNGDYGLDLSGWVEKTNGYPSVVGKLIPHTTADPELGDAFPLQTPIGEVEALQSELRILVRSSEEPWELASPLRYACNTVLPVTPEPDQRPTVFLVQQFLAVGGAEQLAINIMRELQDEIRFVVLAVDPLAPGLGTMTETFREITPWVYSLADFLDPVLRTSFLWNLIDRFNPAGLYVANGATWIYEVMPEIKARYPEIRTSNQVYDAEVGWINSYDLGLVLSLDAHIGADQRICQAYIQRGAEPEQVFQVEHGIDARNLKPDEYTTEKISATKAKLGLPAEARVVTFAARLHPQKRPLDFVELARRMSDDPSNIFLMVGDGPLAETVNQQIAKIGLQNIYRHPFYKPISDVLAVTDVMVLPSEYEGMPLIIAETQIMGKPVVVTDVGNNKEVLELSGGGVVVPQIGDINALMRGVQQMLASPPDPDQIRETILSNYGSTVIARQYKAVILGEGDA